MSKVSECSITHGKKNKGKKIKFANKKIFAEVKDVGSQQEVVQGDDGGGSQDAWLQLQILLSQVTPEMLKNLFLNVCCFIGGSPTVSRRVKSSERMKTFTSEEQIWEASVTFSISGLWLQLRSTWTCWGGRLPLANSTIQGLTLELISLHLENCLSNNLVCRVTLSHEKEKPSTWDRGEEGLRVKDIIIS